MVEVSSHRHSESQRMELRGQIRLASEAVAYYWPMRTFVHHNPLHELEDRKFDDAIRQGQYLRGGKGYLSNEQYRDYFRFGRIRLEHLDGALQPFAHDLSVKLPGCEVRHLEVLRAALLENLTAPPLDVVEAQLRRHRDQALIITLAERLAGATEATAAASNVNEPGYFPRGTLSSWCDSHFGTRIVEQIDGEMIKWCEAFLDEGHAAWPMPERDKGFYAAWKRLAGREWSPCAIADSRRKLAGLPAQPEESLLESLSRLGIGADGWSDYFSFHISALSGWAGFIKWRADQNDSDWQRNYPIDLVQYLAVRLWYERELVQKNCQELLGIDGTAAAIAGYLQRHPVDAATTGNGHKQIARSSAWRLAHLARALPIDAKGLIDASLEDLRRLLAWLDALPESDHGPVWLNALERGYREELIAKLRANVNDMKDGWGAHGAPHPVGQLAPPDATLRGGEEWAQTKSPAIRPQAQAVFCIDVRSEPMRRHLEAIGDYETFGFAGFFNAVIRYQALGNHHATDQFPVILKFKNLVREIPRTYQGRFHFKNQPRAKLVEAGHALLHDLKENVATPFVMAESLGWFYAWPMIGKTLIPTWHSNAMAWLKRKVIHPVATTLTVDKLAKDEVDEMLAAEQRATARRALQEKFGDRKLNLSLERLDYLRRRALAEESVGEPSPQARSFALSAEEESAFVEDLRRSYGINQHAAFARAERITRTGYAPAEQAFTVDTALRMMGLTKNFARLVLFCGHGSTSENNPFESALDCGACGGNAGSPNARLLALMANKPLVREQLAKNGIVIPTDTYFIAGQHDTTSDYIELFDLEDLPPTHRKDLLQLTRDLEAAGRQTSRERCARFPEIGKLLSARRAAREVHRRSGDWSQVRPEWGLSRNAAFIIGRRGLSRASDLDGRVFLHSYDYREDSTGKLLEAVMTGPQVVAQWINMEHYFSATDQEVYGSGSKIYHNVVGRLGVMSGPQSDLRTGLAQQTIMSGPRPYHEPMRLLTVVEAARQRIDQIMRGHRVLQQLYDNEWVQLLAIEPESGVFYSYVPKRGWQEIV